MVSGVDITPETAIVKLMHLLGKNLSMEEVKEGIQTSICGEQSINLKQIKLGEYTENVKTIVYKLDPLRDIKFQEITEAKFRIKNLRSEGVNLKVKIFTNNEIPLQRDEKNSKRDKGCSDYITSFNHGTRTLVKMEAPLFFRIEADSPISWEQVSLEIVCDIN